MPCPSCGHASDYALCNECLVRGTKGILADETDNVRRVIDSVEDSRNADESYSTGMAFLEGKRWACKEIRRRLGL